MSERPDLERWVLHKGQEAETLQDEYATAPLDLLARYAIQQEARALKAEKALKRRNGEFYKIVDGLERCHEEILDLEAKLAAAEKERDEAIKSAQSASFNNSMTAGEGLVVAAKLKALQDAVTNYLKNHSVENQRAILEALAASKEDNHE